MPSTGAGLAMTRAPTALTDFALAIEAGAFAWLINRGRSVRRSPRNQARGVPGSDQLIDRGRDVRSEHVASSDSLGGNTRDETLNRWFVLFFCAAALASIIGGLVHGYFLDPATLVARSLWPLTLIAVGAAALAAWGIGASIQFSPDRARLFRWIAIVEFLIYAAAVVLGMRFFRYAIFNYLPAALFLLAVFTIAHARNRRLSYLLGAVAMIITLAASALQQAKVGILTLGLTHNALYHVLQGVSLLLMFLCAPSRRGFAISCRKEIHLSNLASPLFRKTISYRSPNGYFLRKYIFYPAWYLLLLNDNRNKYK
jgi:MFS family permease